MGAELQYARKLHNQCWPTGKQKGQTEVCPIPLRERLRVSWQVQFDMEEEF